MSKEICQNVLEFSKKHISTVSWSRLNRFLKMEIIYEKKKKLIKTLKCSKEHRLSLLFSLLFFLFKVQRLRVPKMYMLLNFKEFIWVFWYLKFIQNFTCFLDVKYLLAIQTLGFRSRIIFTFVYKTYKRFYHQNISEELSSVKIVKYLWIMWNRWYSFDSHLNKQSRKERS